MTMNGYAILILATLLLSYILSLVADLLNLRALQSALPPELEDAYDAAAYRNSQAYTRVQTQFSWIASTFDLALILVFWYTGGFAALDQMVRGWQFGPVLTGVVYIGLLLLGKECLALPFRLYATFGIEAKFGFNNTTPATFAADLLKGLGLAIVLGVPLLAGVLAFFTYTGPYAWLYCWIATTLVALALQIIAPTWIMPLFNKFTPLEPGALRDAIFAYAASVRFPVDEVFVMDGSKRSNKSNAFFTGWGKHKRIALFDTLIERHTIPELVAVLAHEVGHYQKRHIVKSLVLSIVHMGMMWFLLSIFLHHPGLFQAFYVEQPSVYAGLVFFGLLYSPVELILSIGLQMVSRRHEYEADAYAVQTVATPAAMQHALRKLAVHNLSNLTPHPFYVFLHYSHPPILQRLQALQRLEPQAH